MTHRLRSAPRSFLAGGVIAVAISMALGGCSSTTASTTTGAAAGCTPAHKITTTSSGTLTVATYDFPPYTQLDGSKIAGVEGDLLNKVAKMECLSLTVLSSGGASAAIPAVQAGRADVASGDWWRTKDRAKVVSLSDPVVLDQGAIVSTKGYKTLADLNGKRVGSVVGNLWNDELSKLWGDKFTTYQDGGSAFSDLAAGRVDALVDSVASTTVRFKTKPITGATIVPLIADSRVATSAHPGQVNWPTAKSNTGLTAAINADIATLRKDGTIAKTLQKYDLPTSVAKVGTPFEL